MREPVVRVRAVFMGAGLAASRRPATTAAWVTLAAALASLVLGRRAARAPPKTRDGGPAPFHPTLWPTDGFGLTQDFACPF